MNELDRQQRLFVAAMAEKLQLGGISRREFLRAAASAGFGFASARYLAGSAPTGSRLEAVHANALGSKALQSAFGPDSLQELTGVTWPPVMTAAARIYSGLGLARFHPPVMNLIISNVPGPPIDLYLGGARVTGIFPMGPLMEGSGVNITVLSEARHLNVGIMACPELLVDVDELGRGFVAAIDDLASLAARRHQEA
jgi:hypothetical protein